MLNVLEVIRAVYYISLDLYDIRCTMHIVQQRREECVCKRVQGQQKHAEIRANNEEMWQKFFGAHRFTFLIVCILLKCYFYTIFSTLLNILEFLRVVPVCSRHWWRWGSMRGEMKIKSFLQHKSFHCTCKKIEIIRKLKVSDFCSQQHFPVIIGCPLRCLLLFSFIPLPRCKIPITYLCDFSLCLDCL